VVKYTANHKDIDKSFKVDDDILKEFIVYLYEQELEFSEEDFNDVKPELRNRLQQEFFTNLWGIKEGYRVRIASDPLVQKAAELLKEVTVPQDLFRFSN
jgi:hypothetical protein